MKELEFLKQLGSPGDLQQDAERNLAPAGRLKNNSHIHLPPNFSAFETVKDAVDTAAREKIGVLGASNYYYYEVYEDFCELTASAGIFPLFGLEIIGQIDELAAKDYRINDPGNPGRIYICGKSISKFRRMTPKALEMVQTIRDNDVRRMKEMTARLGDIFRVRGFDTKLDYQAVVRMITRRHGCSAEIAVPQERHIAQAFQESLFAGSDPAHRDDILTRILGTPYAGKPDDAVSIQGEIRSRLLKAGKPAFVAESFLDFAQAYRLILELGGIPCYPILADGASKICEFEQSIDSLVAELKKRNIHMAEFIPIRNKPEVLEKYVLAVRRAGIAVVAGTEHNTLDRLPIEPFCVKGLPISDELRNIFWEGACIMAAHLFLNVHGKHGFVNGNGAPNAAYPDSESRIAGFARLGAAVIETFFRKHGRKKEVGNWKLETGN